jgi:two-component system response regulator GlrR
MSKQTSVLVVDDDADLLELLTVRLQRAGYSVRVAADAKTALDTLAYRQVGAVITDLKMDHIDGLELLGEIARRYPVLPVILLTAHGTIPDAVQATQRGAFAFLTKPINNGELLQTLKDAVTLNPADTGVSDGIDSDVQWHAQILTRSPVMKQLLREARLAANSGASILIEGESGTGKELLARAIHAASARAGCEFVTVNCTAIPETLFESEVFGHVKGSFTGAHRDHAGLFRQADRGTLFLDEVGDLPLTVQVKLLRALQERCIRPVGSEQTFEVDVRVISATNRSLEQAVAEKRFREDLFYRLNVVTFNLPPLLERREDIPLLTSHFLKQFQQDGVATGFSNSAMECLVAASWPGNIRQLANVVHHCLVLCRSDLIPDSLVQHALRNRNQGLTPFAVARDRFESDYLRSLLQATRGNVSQAARLAGRNRSEFYKLLNKHQLQPKKFRDNVLDQ